jgi:hypothetical protein
MYVRKMHVMTMHVIICTVRARHVGARTVRERYLRQIHPHTSLDIFGLEGQSPQRKVKGETMDTSTIADGGCDTIQLR